ncbi:MAG: YaaR family protein [Methylocystaceae bacterium]
MVRINRRDNASGYNPPAVGKTDINRAEPGQFESDLLNKHEEYSQARMKEMLQDIDRLAKRLVGNLNINDLMLYRRMIKDFMREATARAYRVRQQRGGLRRHGRSVLITIEEIDKEVEAMLSDLVNSQTQGVDILETLDKIRGMLVDLMA